MNGYVVYIHRRMDFRPFYIGYGSPKRPYDFHRRSDEWKMILERDGLIVQVLHSGLSKEEAKRIEAELIEGYREILLGFLINKSSGVGQSGLFGEDHNSFLGFNVGISKCQTKFIILAGEKELIDAGFNSGNVSKCILCRPHYHSHKGFTWHRMAVLDPEFFAGMSPVDQRSADRLNNF